MMKRINNSKLTIGFKQIASMINHSTNFQSYIPDDSDKLNDSSLSLSAYEPSQVDIMEQVEQTDDLPAAQKSRIHQQADLYLNQIKNYFGSQKLPLIKLDRKGLLQKYQCVTNLTDSLLTYYSNLEKSFDLQNQASLLSKLSKKEPLSTLDQIDTTQQHKILFQELTNEQQLLLNSFIQVQGRNIIVPHWNNIKQQVKQLNQIFQQQRYQILKVAQPQIQSIQKTYLDEYKNIKKIKNQTQSQYDEVFRKNQNYEGQKQLLEKDLESNNTQYRELKKNKTNPEKLIKMEMSIKLSTQQLSTIQHKLQSSKYELKELQVAITKTNQQLNEFKDNWDRQFIVMYQTVIRSLLQTHYDNYEQFLKSFKNILKLQNALNDSYLSQSQTNPPNLLLHRQSRTVSMDEIDPPRLMRNEKEELQELIKKFKFYEDQIHLFEKYDGECLDFFVEIGEVIKKMISDEIKIHLVQLKDIWITDLFTKSFPKDKQFYQNLFAQIKLITNNFIDDRTKLYKEYKETQVSVKERINNITYLFNCILKDSEKFNPGKVDGFTDYQRMKQQFRQNYLQYQQEAEQLKSKLSQYENKYKQYIDQHFEIISKTKFQFILSFATLSRSVVNHTMKMIDEFDQTYQQQDQIVKSLLDHQTNISFTPKEIQINQTQSLLHNNITTIPKISSRSNSQLTRQPNDTVNSMKETFVLKQLIRVLFLQWTKSIYFRQKFMTELYRSLNKKRPSQLDEIYVTFIDIGGEPPEVLQFIPQKNTDSCIFDLELSFRGFFYMELETFVTISWAKKHLPVTIKVKITSLNGRLRLCYTPNFIGRSWVSFVGEPSMNISIEPTISKYNISVANDIIKEFLIYKIKMLTYPNRETITVPLAEFETEIPQSALDKIKQFVDKMKN
ncbi:unnamed protein product (macronuclear) [Paramecium tetraurelia]|uniref:SMP-LTD domain-containing protein n=1 Tax=Paramecium tetraurelia TaxID=5888 RepID=A0CWJ7_PARTE|nr:uncharacterized protein GSPATT00001367001 [Paramecium tetraurelia]CAK75164.1 unnamed protein product [Paramecium tetraurelia]|eukprot:XP_001442561.1 hypothetical protein (macronuclear) [Paramecium tetraurelia strain d4-2]